jgi:uncharacterized protein YjbI with pentapeptide repeats
MLSAAIVAVGAVVAGLAIWAAIVEPSWLLPDTRGLAAPDRVKAETDLRNTLVTLLGGFAVFVGGLMAAVNVVLTQRVQWRAQVTDRFSKAIEQLGQRADDQLDIRLGAVYALEQIARDSADLHWPIMEVLAAHLREHARGPAAPTHLERVPADFQSIATVLGRRQRSQDPYDQHLDLREVQLPGVHWTNAHLEGADLADAHLETADLANAHLEQAILMDVHLEGADLSGTHLEKANLVGAHLEEADLLGAHLEGANFSGSHLNGADPGGAHVRGADFTGTDLDGVDLTMLTGLTWSQLRAARNVDRTRLPHNLLAETESRETAAGIADRAASALRDAWSRDPWLVQRTLRDELARRLDFDVFTLAAVTESPRGTLAQGYVWDTGEEMEPQPVPLDAAGPSHEAYESGRPVLIRRTRGTQVPQWTRDLERSPRERGDRIRGRGFLIDVTRPGRHRRVVARSVIWVPIQCGEETIGLLSLQCYRANVFDDQHVRVLLEVANSVGLGLTNTGHLQAKRTDGSDQGR